MTTTDKVPVATIMAAKKHIMQAEALLQSTLGYLPDDDLTLVHIIASAGANLQQMDEALEGWLESDLDSPKSSEISCVFSRWRQFAVLYCEVTGEVLATTSVNTVSHPAKAKLSQLRVHSKRINFQQAKSHFSFFLTSQLENHQVVVWHDPLHEASQLLKALQNSLDNSR